MHKKHPAPEDEIGRYQDPKRIRDLKLPERSPVDGKSVREADLDLLADAPDEFLDTTHFDVVRFPPPTWAAEAFANAASDGTQAYSGYRGHPPAASPVSHSRISSRTACPVLLA